MGMVPRGYAQQIGLSAAKLLSDIGAIPAKARFALLSAELKDIRWRDDGTAPTAAIGMLLAAGTSYLYTGPLTKIKLIEVAASGTLNISYYS